MSLHAFVVAAVGADAPSLPFPPFVFALIAAAVFISLAFVVWSFRDAANRHTNTGSRAGGGHGTDHH